MLGGYFLLLSCALQGLLCFAYLLPADVLSVIVPGSKIDLPQRGGTFLIRIRVDAAKYIGAGVIFLQL